MIDFRPENYLCPRIGEEVLLIVVRVPSPRSEASADVLYGCSHRDMCNACDGCSMSTPATLWDCPYSDELAKQGCH